MVSRFPRLRVLALSLAPAFACGGEKVDEAGADRLWQKIQAEDYGTWDTAPGYESPQDTIREHGGTAQVFINTVMAEALQGPAVTAWPDGALIVKESFEGSDLSLIAAMEKQSGSWFYAEWDAQGDVKFAGEPEVCINCHAAGNDFVLVVPLPEG